jgi:hypothetical protein
LSDAHPTGHFGVQRLFTHRSVASQALVSKSVHATHCEASGSQTWCNGSQAMQSALVVQPTIGSPLPSVGQVAPSGTQSPNAVHDIPAGQPKPSPHATQRCSVSRQLVRSLGHPAHSASLLQVWSRHALAGSTPLPVDVAVDAPVPASPPVPGSWIGLLVAQAEAKRVIAIATGQANERIGSARARCAPARFVGPRPIFAGGRRA